MLLWVTVLGELVFCPTSYGQWRLKILPEEAFSDPRQVALAKAAKAGDVKAINQAAKDGADVKAVGRQNATALWYAVVANEKKAFARLLELGADPNQRSETGEPVIGWCVLARDADFLKLALAHGGNSNALNSTGKESIFFRALNEESDEKMELMLKSGADINFRVGEGYDTPILAASKFSLKKTLSLLRHGADPFIRNEMGCDIASGIFGVLWYAKDIKAEAYRIKERAGVLRLIEARGVKLDWSIIEKAKVINFGEASGKEPPMWLRSDRKEPNPEWVKVNPERAERWYQVVLRRPAPKY
jgi:uncharacterized protein